MVFTWRHIPSIICIITIGYLHSETTASSEDWRAIEELAEQHPYVVALLDSDLQYVCTGTIINKRTVLTAGNCIALVPAFVAVGAAVYGKEINKNAIIKIEFTRVHADYGFELKPKNPNVTRMHSNIGVVIVTRPILEVYITAAAIGHYYASELQNKKFNAVGFGKLGYNSNVVTLQHQMYRQAPCMNPKWYYCICGLESKAHNRTYDYEFGKGSPIIYGSEVVGVSAIPCGTLTLTNFKYNIFTVIGPYLPWIEKSQQNEARKVLHARESHGFNLRQNPLNKYIYIVIVISKVFD